jgi:hypothetical protein
MVKVQVRAEVMVGTVVSVILSAGAIVMSRSSDTGGIRARVQIQFRVGLGLVLGLGLG